MASEVFADLSWWWVLCIGVGYMVEGTWLIA